MSLHSADPRERRLLVWVIVVLLVLAVAGAYGLWWFRDAFVLMFSADQEQGISMAEGVVRGLSLLVAAQALALGWLLGRKAQAVRKARLFPLPGSRTVLNLRVREGAEAQRLGTLGLLAAGMFVLLGLGALWLTLA